MNPAAQFNEPQRSAESRLMRQFSPLVPAVIQQLAKSLPGGNVNMDHLKSTGLIGLLQAVRNYQPTCGTSFATYASLCVRHLLLCEIRRLTGIASPRATAH